LEIRIPAADWIKFGELAEDLREWNIETHVSKGHTMRNGFLSIRVNLTPHYTLEQCDTYRKMSNGRRIFVLCYHGHKAWLDILFQRIPLAKVRSVMTEQFPDHWMTKANFHSMAYQIQFVNVGSQMEPQEFAEQCECNEGESSN
jgi:hypothetical protein